MGKGRQRGMKEPGAGGTRGKSLNPGGGWAEGGALAAPAVDPLHNSPGRPQVEAPPLRGSAPYPGPAGRICPEPTTKGPGKLEQAPKEAAQPLTQLWGRGKPRNYGGASSHSAPSKCESPHLSFSSDLRPPHLGRRAQQNFRAGKFTPKPHLKS